MLPKIELWGIYMFGNMTSVRCKMIAVFQHRSDCLTLLCKELYRSKYSFMMFQCIGCQLTGKCA